MIKIDNIFEFLAAAEIPVSFINCEVCEFYARKLNSEQEVIKAVKEYSDYLDYIEDNPKKYPEKIFRSVRQRLRLDPYDRSRDDEISEMSEDDIFSDVVNWNGLLGYESIIKGWIEDIYGVKLGE